MATAIVDSLEEQCDLVVEAGTGTGKTFAYLVPALTSGKKVIISTGTKNLQDQLFNKDIPIVRQALNIPVTCALLKGRSNYLCLHRYKLQKDNPDNLPPRSIKQLQDVESWLSRTTTGDIAEHVEIPEGDPVWPRITSTSDNCIGSECNDYQQCFVMQARREAQAADLVVINHHLLLSDMTLQDDGFGELLPAADLYVIDEAHQLSEIAGNFFGIGISTQQFIELATDIKKEYLEQINESPDINKLADRIIKVTRDWRLIFGEKSRRSPWRTISQNENVVKQVSDLQEELESMKVALEPLCERATEIENCFSRLVVLQSRLQQVTQPSTPEHVHWFEVHHRSVSLHLTPLNIAEAFQARKAAKQGCWVFTSATLSVSGGFDYFVNGLGLAEYNSLLLESPFNFRKQALLYTPVGLPDPNDEEYTFKVIDKAVEVLKESRGNAFFLFTSFRALNLARERLEKTLNYPLFVQGDSPRDVLLERFRQTPHAVLLGTNSFWEGVDVRGTALTCVIIDKLPFAAPNDPVFQARLDAIKEQGMNPFMHYQLPKAVIMLKQGVGRLIRDVNDFGVLMLCDPRLKTKSYGKTFLRSLPPMSQTETVDRVKAFYNYYQPDNVETA
jgi:ATP-dependent DNA helicase DinG